MIPGVVHKEANSSKIRDRASEYLDTHAPQNKTSRFGFDILYGFLSHVFC
jgi:hypothetical protein